MIDIEPGVMIFMYITVDNIESGLIVVG